MERNINCWWTINRKMEFCLFLMIFEKKKFVNFEFIYECLRMTHFYDTISLNCLKVRETRVKFLIIFILFEFSIISVCVCHWCKKCLKKIVFMDFGNGLEYSVMKTIYWFSWFSFCCRNFCQVYGLRRGFYEEIIRRA